MRILLNLLYDTLILIAVLTVSLILGVLYFIFIYEGVIDAQNLMIKKINQYTPIEINFTSIEKGAVNRNNNNISIKIKDIVLKYKCTNSIIAVNADYVDINLSMNGLYLDILKSNIDVGKSIIKIQDISNPEIIEKIEHGEKNSLSLVHDEMDLYLSLISKISKIKFNIHDADISILLPKYSRHFKIVNYETYQDVIVKNKVKFFRQNLKSSGASFDMVDKNVKSHFDISCLNYKIPQCSVKVENINNIIKGIASINNISDIHTDLRVYKHTDYIGLEYDIAGKIGKQNIHKNGKVKINKDDVITGDASLDINNINIFDLALEKFQIKDSNIFMNASFKASKVTNDHIKSINHILMNNISFLVPIIQKIHSVDGLILIDDKGFSVKGNVYNGEIFLHEYIPLPKIYNISSSFYIDDKQTMLFVDKAQMQKNTLNKVSVDIKYKDEFCIEINSSHKNKVGVVDILDEMMENDSVYKYLNEISRLLIEDEHDSVTIDNLHLKIPFAEKAYDVYKDMEIKADLLIEKPNDEIFIDRMPYYANPVSLYVKKNQGSNIIDAGIIPIGYDIKIKEIPMYIKSRENIKISSEIEINNKLDVKASSKIKTDKNTYLNSVVSYKQGIDEVDALLEINIPDDTVAKADFKINKKILSGNIDVKMADLSNIINILTSQETKISDDKIIFPFEKINVSVNVKNTKIANDYVVKNLIGNLKYKNNKFSIDTNLDIQDKDGKVYKNSITFDKTKQSGVIDVEKLGVILHGLNLINHNDIGSLYGRFEYFNNTNIMSIDLKAHDISIDNGDENDFFLLKMFSGILRYTNFNVFALKKAIGKFLFVMDNGEMNLIVKNISMYNNIFGINSHGTIDVSNRYLYISGDVVPLYFITRLFDIKGSNPFSVLKYSINSKVKDIDKNIKFSVL
jgi:hypothetical protein